MLETVKLLALTVPFIGAAVAYASLRGKSVPQGVAGLVAAAILAAVFVGYLFLYRSFGYPLWTRWLTHAALAEPLPGRPDVQINTKLDADWTIVGMNHNWMVLVAKAHMQIGPFPVIYIRWEHVTPQPAESGKKYLSEVQWAELDCKVGGWNPLLITSYAGNNLSGGEVYRGRGDLRKPFWDTPDSKSIFGAALKKGCALFGM